MGVKTLFAISLLIAIILIENETPTRSGLVSAFQVCQEKQSVCKPISRCKSIFDNLAYIADPPFCDANLKKVCCPLPHERPPLDLTNPWSRQCQKYQKEFSVRTGFISDGEFVKKGELPFMARLGEQLRNGVIKWKCGGTLIAPKWVLTASHCLDSEDNINVVRLGQVDFSAGTGDSSTAQQFVVSNKIMYMSYDGESKGDFGLLKLNKNAIFNANVLPACLPVDNTDGYNNFTAAGWGSTYTGGPPSDRLLKVKIYRNRECLQYANEDLANNICAGSVDTHGGTCRGDSGGPILVHHPSVPGMQLVVGVTAHGAVCGEVIDDIHAPTIYTRVNSFMDWISRHVEIDSWA